MAESKYLTASGAARILGVTPGAVRLMRKRGDLEMAEKTDGGIHLFLREEVERLAVRRQKSRARFDIVAPSQERDPVRRSGGGR